MIYPYECPRCGRTRERICSLAEYVDSPGMECPECFVSMTRVITPPRLFTKKFSPFWSPVDGSFISNSRELSEHNKRNNVVQLHEGYDERAVEAFTKTDWSKEKEKERSGDMHEDMRKSIQKLEEGYTPTPAPEIEDIPDA